MTAIVVGLRRLTSSRGFQVAASVIIYAADLALRFALYFVAVVLGVMVAVTSLVSSGALVAP